MNKTPRITGETGQEGAYRAEMTLQELAQEIVRDDPKSFEGSELVKRHDSAANDYHA